MKLFKKASLAMPLLLTVLLIGAVGAYFATASTIINCPAGGCEGDEPYTDDGDLINGSQADDLITAGDGPDIIFGNGGDDEIYGNDGDDQIYGGDDSGASDKLCPGYGNDLIFGGRGHDIYAWAPTSDGCEPDHPDDGTDLFIFQAGDINDETLLYDSDFICAGNGPDGDTALFVGYQGTEMQSAADAPVDWFIRDPWTGALVQIPPTQENCNIRGVFDERPVD